MAEMIARFKPGQNVPAFCTAQVLAGRFVAISAPKTAQGDYSIAHAGAGARVFGVSERDSGPTTDPASSWTRRVNVVRTGAIARVIAGVNLTAGQQVESNATGQAILLTAGIATGQVLNTVASGAVAEVALY